MIPSDTPPFILLVLATGMMALIVAIMSYVARMHLLGYEIRILFTPWRIECFQYLLISIGGLLAAQFLTLVRIIFRIQELNPILDAVIMSIFLGENGYLINFIFWVSRYRHEMTVNPIE